MSFLSIWLGLFKKTLLRRTRSPNLNANIPIGFLMELLLPLLLFWLVNWMGSYLDPFDVDGRIPTDVYTIGSVIEPSVFPTVASPTLTFTDLMEAGYSAKYPPVCCGYADDFTWFNCPGLNVPWPPEDASKTPNDDDANVFLQSGAKMLLLDCTAESLDAEGIGGIDQATIADSCTTFGENILSKCQKKIIGLAPGAKVAANDAAVNQLIEDHIEYLKKSFPASVGAHELYKKFESHDALEEYIQKRGYGLSPDIPMLAFSIAWNSPGPDYDYSLRLNATHLFDTSMNPFDNYAKRSDFSELECNFHLPRNFRHSLKELGDCAGTYVGSDFPAYQTYIMDSFILERAAQSAANPFFPDFVIKANAAGFPSQSFTLDIYWDFLSDIFSGMLFLTFMITFYNAIKQTSEEKELGLNEGMKMMGLSDFHLSFSWWTVFVLQYTIVALVLTLLSGGVFRYSSKVVIFFYFFSFLMSSTSFCVFLTAFFDDSRKAGLIGLLLYFAGWVVAGNLAGDSASKATKVICSLLHPAVLYFRGTDNFVYLEQAQVGVTADTIGSPKDQNDLSMMDTLVLMWFDTFLFIVLHWYFDKIVPSSRGVALPFYFFLVPSYWSTGEVYTISNANYDVIDASEISFAQVEAVSEECKQQEADETCVQIKGLRKVYHTNAGPKVAVSSLDLNFYKNQITCLLGHNGAGKTTTISMLNGLTKSSAGDAKVGKFSVTTDMARIRQTLGVCPQHDVLFKVLTVFEHLQLFARIKGIPESKITPAIDLVLQEVGLTEKRNEFAFKMSGGQKRKLSLAIAFMGDSTIVVLDEPTSGMDPFSRRATWDLIRSKKKDRIILLTTHFMDEADLLGDRIAIMSEGNLKCAGSSLFLKKEFGVGYNMTLEKKEVGTSGMAPSDMDRGIEQFVKTFVPEATRLSAVGSEIAFQLPLASSAVFPNLLSSLDKQMDSLNVVTYGVAVTTLEEVFLKIANDAIKGEDTTGAADVKEVAKVAYSKISATNKFEFFKRHVFALLQKRLVITSRSYALWIGSYLLPVAMIATGMLTYKLGSGQGQFPSVTLNINEYTSSRFKVSPVIYNGDSRSHCYSVPGDVMPLFTEYMDMSTAGWCAAEGDNSEGESGRGRGKEEGNTLFECSWDTFSAGFATQRVDMGMFGESFVRPEPSIERYSCTDPEDLTADSCELFLNCSTEGMEPEFIDVVAPELEHAEFRKVDSADLSSKKILVEDLLGVRELGEYLDLSRDDFRESRMGAFLWSSPPHMPTDQKAADYDNEEATSGLNFGAKKFVEYTAMVNFTHAHSLPTFVSLANEMIVKMIDPNVTITARNHPMPQTLTEEELSQSESLNDFIFMMMFALPFIPASFASTVISERTSKAKHILVVSGVTPITYWLTNFIFDFLSFLVSGGMVIAMWSIFDIEELTGESSGTATSLLLLWGAAMACFCYATSFFFESTLSNFGFIFMSNLLLGYFGGLAAHILLQLSLIEGMSDDVVTAFHWVRDIGHFFPSFSLCYGFLKLQSRVSLSSSYGMGDVVLDAGDDKIAGEEVKWLVGCVPLYFVLTLVIDKLLNSPRMMGKFLEFFQKPMSSFVFPSDLDEDVEAENARMSEMASRQGGANRPPIFVEGLKKQYGADTMWVNLISSLGAWVLMIYLLVEYGEWYFWCLFVAVFVGKGCCCMGSKYMRVDGESVGTLKKVLLLPSLCKTKPTPRMAVRGVSFGVEEGQCFGLLGVNGAGKTTTLGIVSGEFPASEGDAFLDNMSLKDDLEEVRRLVGYCPQFDALFKLMTGREHLRLYARLKGVEERDVDAVVEEQISRMDLTAHCDRTAGGYSGGNRRKLQVACALIGDPKIIFLDEPSTGMDPLARRFMWSIVNQITRQGGTSVILTTHSMEEADALCSKIGIMVDGYFKCIGSSQHLKKKFGKGFMMELRAGMTEGEGKDAIDQKIGRIVRFMRDETFKECEVLETQEYKVRLKVGGMELRNGLKIGLGDLFGILESNKTSLGLQDYSVSQTSLEQIFNQFAQDQAAIDGAGDKRSPMVSPIASVEHYVPPPAGMAEGGSTAAVSPAGEGKGMEMQLITKATM